MPLCVFMCVFVLFPCNHFIKIVSLTTKVPKRATTILLYHDLLIMRRRNDHDHDIFDFPDDQDNDDCFFNTRRSILRSALVSSSSSIDPTLVLLPLSLVCYCVVISNN